MTSFYQVILQGNKFRQDLETLYEFWITGNNRPVGYMLAEFVSQMEWPTTGFKVNQHRRTVRLKPARRRGEGTLEACQRALMTFCRRNVARLDGIERWLRNWDRDSHAPFHQIQHLHAHLHGVKVPSPLRGVFGILTAGAHLNMFTISQAGMRIWVAERASNASTTYAGKLDQLVAGGMEPRDNDCPLETLGREAMEEAGLAVDTRTLRVTQDGKPVGNVRRGPHISFYDKKDETAGSEQGQLEPGIRFTFDLEVDAAFTPEPREPDSIAGFFLHTVDEVKASLKRGEWKPNCALVMLDFLLRKGHIRPGEDEHYCLLESGLRRRLPFLPPP